jgi:hypothetical protein
MPTKRQLVEKALKEGDTRFRTSTRRKKLGRAVPIIIHGYDYAVLRIG